MLELGGKSVAIVYSDADMDTVIDSVRRRIFFNVGQVCSAMSRLIVHKEIHDELVDGVAAMARSLSVGTGIDRSEFGPNLAAMISKWQGDRGDSICRGAESNHALGVTGGNKPNHVGWFLEPTIYKDVTQDMAIANNEVFSTGAVCTEIRTR